MSATIKLHVSDCSQEALINCKTLKLNIFQSYFKSRTWRFSRQNKLLCSKTNSACISKRGESVQHGRAGMTHSPEGRKTVGDSLLGVSLEREDQ